MIPFHAGPYKLQPNSLVSCESCEMHSMVSQRLFHIILQIRQSDGDSFLTFFHADWAGCIPSQWLPFSFFLIHIGPRLS